MRHRLEDIFQTATVPVAFGLEKDALVSAGDSLSAFLLLVLLAVSACGGGDGEAVQPAAGTQRTTQADEQGAMGAPPTEAALVGEWALVGTITRALFRADGTFAIDARLRLEDDPSATGTYEVDGRTLTFTSEGVAFCIDPATLRNWNDTEADVWTWEVGMLDGGKRMHAIWIDGGCQIAPGDRWLLDRFGP